MSTMNPNTVRVGARIEFWEVLDGPDGPKNLIGAATKDAAFAAVDVPRVGDRVSVVSLAGATAASPVNLLMRAPDPFLRVEGVEHYLMPVGENGEVPEWWEREFTTPSADLVFRAQAVRHGGTSLVVALAGQGWNVDHALFEYGDADSA